MKNNFQQLEEEELRQSRGPSTEIYDGVMGGMRSMKFVGGLFDHFIPKMLRFFVTILGGNDRMSPGTRVSHDLTDDQGDAARHPRSDYPNRQA